MTARSELESDYTVNEAGCITDPGKFEGSPLWVAYFYSAWLDGGADDDDGTKITFSLDAYDAEIWPELVDCSTVELWLDDNGFVYGDAY